MDGREMKDDVERAARGPWMQRVAAVGYVAKGVDYAVIGVYALLLALGKGGGFLDARDTPKAVERQPFGDVLLIALAAGLACHALWRFVEAFVRPPEKSGLKRLGKRVSSIGSGLVSGFLAVTAFQHLAGRSHPRGSWIQRALRWDNGDWLVIAVGAGFRLAGGYQLVRAFTDRYRKHLRIHELSPAVRPWVLRICRFGVAARGVVAVVAGWLFLRAGLDDDARHATGTGAALRTIMRQPSGAWMLGIVAAGLIAYALFMAVNARYRRAFA
jgi:hypothetical protein